MYDVKSLMLTFEDLCHRPFELYLSPITRALFNDSGWYQSRLSSDDDDMAWGRGWGCSFAQLSMPLAPRTFWHKF
jgi:hypothetical protein